MKGQGFWGTLFAPIGAYYRWAGLRRRLRDKALAYVAPAIALIVIITLVGSIGGGDEKAEQATASQQPTAVQKPTSTPEPPPIPLASVVMDAVDATAIQHAVEEFFRFYNEGNMLMATAQVSSELDRKCGGATEHAFAYTQLRNTEGIRYDVVDISIAPLSKDRATVDITYDTYDMRAERAAGTGEKVIVEVMRNKLGDWVFAEAALPWVIVFCR